MKNWFNKAIIYHIFIDRFNGLKHRWTDSPDFLGGNISGVISKLDYISELGCNTIWLSPFYEGVSYHGYHITNFNSVDYRFGSEKELEKLIQLCHARNMKIITDFVPNHSSVYHPYFQDALKNKKSEYAKWYFLNRERKKYLSFLNFKELPKLNLDYHDCAQHLLNSAQWLYSLGFDGLRIDHVAGVSPSFLTKLKQISVNKILLGEAWLEGITPEFHETLNIPDKTLMNRRISQWKLQLSYKEFLDGILDFYGRRLIINKLQCDESKDNYWEKRLQNHYARYSDKFKPVLFLDNHDVDRILYTLHGNIDKLLEGLQYIKAQGFPICLYYGTEQGLNQQHSVKRKRPHADLEARRPIEWNTLNNTLYGKVREIFTD